MGWSTIKLYRGVLGIAVIAIVVVGFLLLQNIPYTEPTDKIEKDLPQNITPAELDENQWNELNNYHDWLLEEYDIDYQLVITEDQPNIDLFANKQFEEKQVGKRSKSGRGILLVIDTKKDLIRMEISTSLEPIFTDGFIRFIEEHQMVPFFREGEIFVGIIATSEIIYNRAQEAERKAEFDDNLTLNLSRSSGGGASAKARIGKGQNPALNYEHPEIRAGNTPEETLAMYKESLRRLIVSRNMDIFTERSRREIGHRAATRVQVMNGLKSLRECERYERPIKYNTTRTRAALIYSLENRSCWPLLFEKGKDGKWRLDNLAHGIGFTFNMRKRWWVDFRKKDRVGGSIVKSYKGGKFDHRYWSGIWRYNFALADYDAGTSDIGGERRACVFLHPPEWGARIVIGTGIAIQEIHPGSYMSTTPLKAGDIILEWGGNPIVSQLGRSRNELFAEQLAYAETGEEVVVKVQRGSDIMEFTLYAPPPSKEIRWGITYSQDGLHMPTIFSLAEDSPLRDMGAQAGDVIYKWNGKTYYGQRQFWNLMKNAEAGENITIDILRPSVKGGVIYSIYAASRTEANGMQYPLPPYKITQPEYTKITLTGKAPAKGESYF